MGFLDSVSNAVSRGVAGAQRTSRSTQLKLQLNDLIKQRKEMAAQLGANLYEATKEDPALRQGREPLYDAIANIDLQRAAIEEEIAQIEAEALASQQAAIVYRCPRCGSSVQATDMFCSGCGTPIQEIVAASQSYAPIPPYAAIPGGKTCAVCGAPMGADDKFCMSCGSMVAAPISDPIPEAAPIEAAAEDAAETTETPVESEDL